MFIADFTCTSAFRLSSLINSMEALLVNTLNRFKAFIFKKDEM